MIKLKELLEGKERIKLIVEDEDYRKFLEFAKEEGCLWRNGDIINPYSSNPSEYTKIAVITKEYLIYHPSGWISFMSLQNVSEYKFSNLKANITIDEYIEKTYRTEKIDGQYRSVQKAKELAYKNKCEENRKVSQIQIKYKDITSKLQQYFFVKYENNTELLNLFILFREYGYENKYNIDLDNFNKDPKIICVDNRNMFFIPSDMAQCACAFISNKKFYKYDDFEKIMHDIFNNYVQKDKKFKKMKNN